MSSYGQGSGGAQYASSSYSGSTSSSQSHSTAQQPQQRYQQSYASYDQRRPKRNGEGPVITYGTTSSGPTSSQGQTSGYWK